MPRHGASARRTGDGEYVPLAEQDQALWDWQAIAEAEALLRRASALGAVGRYQLEAALQSAHVYRCRTGHANWAEVVALYDALLALAGSPVVAVNRALALAEVDGAGAALDALQAVAGDARLAEYQPYWAARAELLARTGASERSAARLRNGDRARARSRRAPLPAAPPGGFGRLTDGQTGPLRHENQEQKREEHDEMDEPGQHRRAPGAEADDADGKRQDEQHGIA